MKLSGPALAFALGACSGDLVVPDTPDAGRVELTTSRMLRLPSSAFRESVGVLVAPLVETDGTRLLHMRVWATCKVATTVELCAWATDPESEETLEECAKPVTPCGPYAGIVDAGAPTSFIVGERSAIELIIISPQISAVHIRGATAELLP